MNEKKFVYVFSAKDKDKLVLLGYKLIKEDKQTETYVFENQNGSSLYYSNIIHIFSDTLTF